MLVRLAAPVPRRSARAIAALSRMDPPAATRDPDGATGPVGVHRSSDPGHWILTWPWASGIGRRRSPNRRFGLEREVPPDRNGPTARAGSAGLARLERERIDAARRAGRGSGQGPAAPDRLDQRHERQDHHDPADRPHAARGREARRLDDVRRDRRRDGDRRARRLDGSGRRDDPDRDDIDIAVLETARGGILLRGVGYESNEASVVTNVSSDHLDLQGIHTLPELAEVKSTIARITKPSGWVVLNADDRHVAAVARRVRGKVAFFSLEGDASPRVRRHLARRGARLPRARRRHRRGRRRSLAASSQISPTCPSCSAGSPGTTSRTPSRPPARAGAWARRSPRWARACARSARRRRTPAGVSMSSGTRRGSWSSTSPTTRRGWPCCWTSRRPSRGRSGRGRRRREGRAFVTFIVGLAGDRPDDTLRGVGRQVASRVDRFVQKEMLHYLRGRTRVGPRRDP